MTNRTGLPNHGFALERYRRIARRYDAATRLIAGKRLRAIELLRLNPGDTVLDAACGTGSAFEALARAAFPGRRTEPARQRLCRWRHLPRPGRRRGLTPYQGTGQESTA